MWQQQPDYARYKEKLNGERWLVNRQEGMLKQIKPDAATQQAQFVLVNQYRLSARLDQAINIKGSQFKISYHKIKIGSLSRKNDKHMFTLKLYN